MIEPTSRKNRKKNPHHIISETSDIETFILLIIIYNVVNLNISKGFLLMDTRLLVIAGPLLVAASWALFNIGRLALQQIQRLRRGS